MLKTISVSLLWLSFLASHPCFGQQIEIDSLKLELTKKQHDTTRILTLSWLLSYYSQDQPENVAISKKIESIVSKNLNKPSLHKDSKNVFLSYQALLWHNKASYFSAIQNDSSIYFYQKAIALFEKIKKYDEAGFSLMGIAIEQQNQNQLKQAITGYYKALKQFEKSKNEEGVAYANSSLSTVFQAQKKYKEAVDCSKKSLAFHYKLNGITTDNIYQKGLEEHNLGHIYMNMNLYSEAEMYLLRSLKNSQKSGSSMLQSIVYDKLGGVHRAKKQYNLALSYYTKASEISEDSLSKANCNISIGEMYYELKQYPKAISFLSNALKTSSNLELQEHAFGLLYKTYKANNQPLQSLEMLEKFNTLKDSAKVEETKIFFEEQKLSHAFEKKILVSKVKLSNEKFENQRKKLWLFILVFALVGLCLLAYFLNKFYKQKAVIAAKRNNELNQQLLLSQMNPHFIFNSIDNIQSLIHLNQNDEAISYLTKFSKLTRQILENSTQNYITLEEEIEMLDNYLNIQRLLYNNKFTFHIKTIAIEDKELILLPPMLTQPFIENAIKHGVKNSEQGTIDVEFQLHQNRLFFEVKDNGKGIQLKTENEHNSLATKIVQERLQLEENEFVLKLENIMEDAKIVGFSSSFEIPYIYDK